MPGSCAPTCAPSRAASRCPPSTWIPSSSIPYNVIRFIEIPRESIGAAGISPHRPGAVQLPAEAAGAPEGQPVIILGTGAAPAAQEPDEERLEHLEPDAELLRRIREA